MTDSKTYNLHGAVLTITVNTWAQNISVHYTLHLSPLDISLSPHSGFNLLSFLTLPQFTTSSSFWWCKTSLTRKYKTGAQARRAIKTMIAKVDEAVATALLARVSRAEEHKSILH